MRSISRLDSKSVSKVNFCVWGGRRNMKSKRIVSIDILKIVCIIMVVMLHLTSYGVKDISIKFLSIPYWFIAIFKSLSIVGVNCFVLISGYFLCQSDIKYKRILPLWIQV